MYLDDCVGMLSDLTWLPLLVAAKMSWYIIITNRYENYIFFSNETSIICILSSQQVSSLMELEKSHSRKRPLKTMDSLQLSCTNIKYLLKNSQFNKHIQNKEYHMNYSVKYIYFTNPMLWYLNNFIWTYENYFIFKNECFTQTDWINILFV